MYGLFNNRAFTVVSIIFIVTNPYCDTGFDIIQPYHHTTAMIHSGASYIYESVLERVTVL